LRITDRKNIAGVVILYNPGNNVIENINSYMNQINHLFIFDNSKDSVVFVRDSFRKYNKVEYIFNGGNLGVALCLNKAAQIATNRGYSYLLTMDQDSKAASDMIENMLVAVSDIKDIGIISPFHVNKFETKQIPSEIFNEELVVQTSGNLLNLSIYQLIGHFKEEFFIDYVDTEYCLRLNKNGYKVIRVNNALIYHNEADISERIFFRKKIFPHNHAPVRLYFKTRNRFYLRDLYKKYFPDYFKYEFTLFRNMFIKIIIYEKNKLKKIGFALKGYTDYLKNIFYSPF